MSVETAERIRASVRIDPQLLSTMALAVDTEFEVAEAVRQVVGQLSVEEAEDELLDVFAATTSPLGARSFWAKAKAVGNTPVIELVAAAAKKMKDAPGVRVHPVLVLDELDKLEPPPKGPDELTANVEGRVDGGAHR